LERFAARLLCGAHELVARPDHGRPRNTPHGT
jgi:hypothetical protein